MTRRFAVIVLLACGSSVAKAQESPPLPTKPAEPPPARRAEQTAPAANALPSTRTDVVAKLTVRGDAELQKPADQLQLRLGTITEATEAAQAMELNSRVMQDVVAAIEKLGLDKKEYQTGRFQVRPTYSHRPRQPEPNWRPTITGYEVTNTIEIKTQKLELAGPLIESATKAGANNVESIAFDLADRRKHRGEVIAAATANAMADARVLAEASSQRLVRVLSINLDNAAIAPPVFDRSMGRAMMAAEAMEAPPINPGDVGVHANVTIVYEIAPMN